LVAKKLSVTANPLASSASSFFKLYPKQTFLHQFIPLLCLANATILFPLNHFHTASRLPSTWLLLQSICHVLPGNIFLKHKQNISETSRQTLDKI
jgi:hypothetical protein